MGWNQGGWNEGNEQPSVPSGPPPFDEIYVRNFTWDQGTNPGDTIYQRVVDQFIVPSPVSLSYNLTKVASQDRPIFLYWTIASQISNVANSGIDANGWLLKPNIHFSYSGGWIQFVSSWNNGFDSLQSGDKIQVVYWVVA